MLDDLTLTVPPAESAPKQPASTPFIIVLERLDEQKNGTFVPGAVVQITPELRKTGLLAALPAEELKTLVCMLTLLTPNGDCVPMLPELAEACKVIPLVMRSRMARLVDFRFQGRPIIYEVERGSLPAYMLAPEIVAFAQQPKAEESPPLTIKAAGREAVIEYSRTHYARPRLEVEREIARANNWEEPVVEDTPEAKERQEVYQRLLAIGVGRQEATSLLDRFPLNAIQRQIEWLPYRHAKSRVHYLLAAIEGNYQPPRFVPPATVEQLTLSEQEAEDEAPKERGTEAD